MTEIELTDEDRARIVQLRQEHLGYVLYDDGELLQLIRDEEERKKLPPPVPPRPRRSGADIVRIYWNEERVNGARVFRRATEETGILIGSLTVNEWHAPVFDLDFEVVQDSSRITFKRDVNGYVWPSLLEEFVSAGLVLESGFKHTVASSRGLVLRDPFIEFSVPLELRKSSTAGHFHLLLQQEIEWPRYLKILSRMAYVELIERGYLNLCKEAQMGLLLKPTLKKQEMPCQYTGYGR